MLIGTHRRQEFVIQQLDMVEHAKLPLFKEYQLMSALSLMIIWEIKYDMKEALQV
jgi:hypothetical protein